MGTTVAHGRAALDENTTIEQHIRALTIHVTGGDAGIAARAPMHGTPMERINAVRAGYSSMSMTFDIAWNTSLEFLGMNP